MSTCNNLVPYLWHDYDYALFTHELTLPKFQGCLTTFVKASLFDKHQPICFDFYPLKSSHDYSFANTARKAHADTWGIKRDVIKSILANSHIFANFSQQRPTMHHRSKLQQVKHPSVVLHHYWSYIVNWRYILNGLDESGHATWRKGMAPILTRRG